MKNEVTLDAFFKRNEQKEEQRLDASVGPPSGWKWVKLKHVAKYINGRAFKQEEWDKKGLPIIRIQNLTNPNAPFNYCSKPVEAKYYVKNGDLLISWSATLDAFIWNGGDAVLNQHIFKAEVNEKIVDKKFLFYAIKYILEEMKRKIHGSTMQHITKSKFENTEIPLPPLDVQRRVVARVEELTSRIEQAKKLREEALKETEKIMQTALHQTFKNPEQKGWKQYTINEITVDLKSGFACSKKYEVPEGIPHLRPNNIGYYGKLDLSKIVCIPENMVDLKTYSLKRGDVLFNNTNSKELVGRAALVEEDLNYAFSNHITRIRVNTELLTPEWLVTCLNYLWLKGYFLHICQKWIGQAGINTRMLKSVKVYIPSIEEQKAITERLNKIQKIIENFNTQQNKTKAEIESLSQAILKAAFSGKL